ncbi:class F sortase [Dactylosporangium roseum]|uniref:Class F sortase n=1 Tax=Dactylosporangium roseum TaxID=47989 RepID=A0ABY5ZAF1_9ACTN|nr:class F sortase [Dactylosporangium roseum]UWZ38644.1 class F sortase [Dactylosporangium roseum]
MPEYRSRHALRSHRSPARFLVRRDGTWRAATAMILIAVVVSGVSLIGASFTGGSGPPPFIAADGGSSAGIGAATARGGAGLSASPPARLAIGTIEVDAPVQAVDVDRDGMLEAPSLQSPKNVGWYRRGPTPGEIGNSVLVGHVDTAASGPAVFYDLGRLKPGDLVTVAREDGSTVVFRVDSVRMFAKADFPADLVYGPADHAQLRLVTCGGAFDRRRGVYLANTVVTATLTSWRQR